MQAKTTSKPPVVSRCECEGNVLCNGLDRIPVLPVGYKTKMMYGWMDGSLLLLPPSGRILCLKASETCSKLTWAWFEFVLSDVCPCLDDSSLLSSACGLAIFNRGRGRRGARQNKWRNVSVNHCISNLSPRSSCNPASPPFIFNRIRNTEHECLHVNAVWIYMEVVLLSVRQLITLVPSSEAGAGPRAVEGRKWGWWWGGWMQTHSHKRCKRLMVVVCVSQHLS